MLLALLGLSTAQPMHQMEESYGNSPYAGYSPEQLEISRAELLDYLAALRMREAEQMRPALEPVEEPESGSMKLKRGWRNRWGNKYADNKSYGFWITALNKAGNYKRGKRGEPFVPGMSAPQAPFNFAHAITGEKGAPLKELIPDHDYTVNN